MAYKNIFAKFKGFENIKIEKIEVVKSANRVIFHGLSQEIIDFFDIERAENEIKRHYGNALDIKLSIKYQISIRDKDIEIIKNNILYILAKASNILSKANGNLRIDFKDNFFFVTAKSQPSNR